MRPRFRDGCCAAINLRFAGAGAGQFGIAPYNQRMRIAYLDAFSGISGDMTVGALLDAGADAPALIDALVSLNLGAGFRVEKTKRAGIAASKFHVTGGQAKNHRHLPAILKIIDAASLPERAK